MEAVQAFNQEMTSLYEVKPPISKAKMTSITKSAIRAIKFYKHVVQSVEKFIQKCKTEYKIPGLYVIDSIVRQSRHQFGADKDVFAPRFAKNSMITFYHLYKCTEEEKSKVIRVLNLWQKNNVFPSDAVQPLFDMANPHSEIFKKLDHQMKTNGKIVLANSTPVKDERRDKRPDSNGGIDSTALKQLQTIQQFLKNPPPVQFNKKLLDFDYGSDDDSENGSESTLNQGALEAVKALLGNPTLLNHLVASGDITQSQISQLQQLLPGHGPPQAGPQPGGGQQFSIPGLGGGLQAHQPASMAPPPQPFLGGPPPGYPPHMAGMAAMGAMPSNFPNHPPPIMPFGPAGMMGLGVPRQSPLEEGEHAGDTDDDVMMIDDLGAERRNKARERRRSSRDRRSRSRSGSRGKKSKRRRSRSRSRSRERRGKRRSRSRDRDDRKRRLDDDKRSVERAEERKKKGLPPMKEGFLTVCSTTLWVGHLSKLVQQDDLSDTFGTYGEIVSIDLITPRGCAFVCMNRRMDANRALKNLHKFRLHGKQITLAWAPGKGMKDKQWKDYWDLDLGSSYIPLEKISNQTNMADLEEGGMIDEETLPDWLRSLRGSSVGGQQFPGQETVLAPPPHLSLPQPHELITRMPQLEGMPPPFAPPGLGLLPPPGAPLGSNLLIRPQLVAGPPPGFPGFDSSQPPPVRLAGVLGAPLLPAVSRPPAAGLLGPPPDAGAAPMDLEEKERSFDDRSERRDRDRRSGGRWGEEREDRRDKRGSRFREEERPGGRRESRWGRDEERRDREGDRPRRDGRGREGNQDDLNTRLQNMADGPNPPVSLLDMPDIPKPEGSDFGLKENEGQADSNQMGQFATFPPPGLSNFGQQPQGFGSPGFGGAHRGGFAGQPQAEGQFGFDGFRGRGRGRGGWRGRGGGDFRGQDNGFRGRGGPRGGRGGFGGQGLWSDAPEAQQGFDNFDDGFRGRGRGRGPRGGRGGRDDRGRGGRGGFGAFGDWDNENGRGRGLLDGEGFGDWNPENSVQEEQKKEGRRERKSRWGDSNEATEENANGVFDQPPSFDEQQVPAESHHIQDATAEGLESFDVPSTPPGELNSQSDHEVPNDFGGGCDNVEMEDVNPGYEETLTMPPHTEFQPSSDPGNEDQTQESYEPQDEPEYEPEDQTSTICEDNDAPQDYQIESEPTVDASEPSNDQDNA